MRNQILAIRAELKNLEILKDSLMDYSGYIPTVNDENGLYDALDAKIDSMIIALSKELNLTYGDILEAVYNDEVLELIISDLKLEVKPLHRFRVRVMDRMLNEMQTKGYTKATQYANYIKDFKTYYNIDVKVNDSYQLVIHTPHLTHANNKTI